MISLFERELIRMEQEVRDLKTIHQRGLGTTRFYIYERQIEVPSGFYWFFFDGTVEDPSLMPMSMIAFMDGQLTMNFTIEFTPTGFSIRALAEDSTVTVRIITSQVVTNITTRIEPWV